MMDYVKTFANAVWGHPEAVLKRDDHIGVDYIDLTEYMDAASLFIGPALWHDKILIREEYRIAMHELETNPMYCRAAYVTGHPGIGKTFFLAYVLIRHLAQRRPVAWQLYNASYILFTETATLHPIHDANPLLDHGPLWALSDSNAHVQSPFPLFYDSLDYVKTIQSTSPRAEHWKGWSKYGHAECYVMDIWSEKEIIDLAKLLDLSTERMTALAKSWGGIPRKLLTFGDRDIEKYRTDAKVAVKSCRDTISSIAQRDIVEDGRSNFFFSRPENKQGMTCRMFARAHVQTPTLRRFLGDALRWQTNTVKLDFFRALSQATETRQVAESIYKSWFQIYISAASPLQCHWIHGSDGKSSLPLSTKRDAVEEPAYYWVAPKNFPGIDSMLILDKAIYAFQINIGPRHESPLDGMCTLRDHLPADLKDLPWSVVFIGIHESGIEGVARKWVDKLFFPMDQMQVSIGWSEVNPVMDWVSYAEIHDEPDPDIVVE